MHIQTHTKGGGGNTRKNYFFDTFRSICYSGSIVTEGADMPPKDGGGEQKLAIPHRESTGFSAEVPYRPRMSLPHPQ